MNAIDFILDQHAQVHAASVGEGRAPIAMEDLLFWELDEDSARRRPLPFLNSVAWLVWHMARCEDVAVNAVIAGSPTVLDESWLKRLEIDRRDIGTGMNDAEVTGFSETVAIGALRDYRAEVGKQTRRVLREIDLSSLDEVPEPEHLARIFQSGAVGSEGGWVRGFWRGKTKGWFLWLATGHNYYHFGEAEVVRNAMGLGSGR